MEKTKKIVALGFFDGVHLGHQALLRQCVRLARENDALPAAITFDAHPQSLFSESTPPLISTVSDRMRLLAGYGIEKVYTYPVTEKVMSTNWRDFLEQLICGGAAGFVCGNDFRFGHRGEGSAETLTDFCAERSLPCVIVSQQLLGGIRISSTHIRKLLGEGRMDEAVRFLGHPHVLTGKVVTGRQLGRTIGIPTANILIPENLLVPKLGVYACTCRLDEKNLVAVTNIGSRPTVEGHQVRAESWILDFDGDLYGKELTLSFHKFLRLERKFENLEELKAQIQKDAAEAYRLLK